MENQNCVKPIIKKKFRLFDNSVASWYNRNKILDRELGAHDEK